MTVITFTMMTMVMIICKASFFQCRRVVWLQSGSTHSEGQGTFFSSSGNIVTRPPYLLSGNGFHSMGWLGVPTCIKTTHSQINHFQQIQIRFLGITNIVTLTNIMKKNTKSAKQGWCWQGRWWQGWWFWRRRWHWPWWFVLARAGYAASAWAVNGGDAGDDDDEDFRDPFPHALGS